MDMQTKTIEDVVAILSLFDGFGPLSSEDIWWRTGGEYAPITFIVNCNDLFAWGCSDCERITVDDLPQLRQAIEDCKSGDDDGHPQLLWVARKRGQRPQKAYYKYFNVVESAHFDACGSIEDQCGTKEFKAKRDIATPAPTREGSADV